MTSGRPEQRSTKVGRDIRQRLRVVIRGLVQGVGFRPFVYRLSQDLGLAGWVINSTEGVFIEVEGETASLESFLTRLREERPPHSYIQSLEHTLLDPVGYDSFEIRKSDASGQKIVPVLPDVATCPECLHEILDPNDRRHRYAFTNCTHCGPRYSIIEALPYDRPNTTMASFTMCERCLAEYEDPANRRFHAQPNACPACGPHLELWDRSGRVIATHDDALLESANAVRDGAIVALKGLGGFHLVLDARDDAAVRRLRERKHRDEKPLAVMVPSLPSVYDYCVVSEAEKRLLTSSEMPIVLLHRRQSTAIAPAVAPGNPYLGVLLPYTPLHHLFVRELGFPVVATSGNLSEEPICINEDEALERLGPIADLLLVHNRPIARHVDDSVTRTVADRVLVLRRARGYAPLPIVIKTGRVPKRTLAVGGHLKNAVALSVDRQIIVSQHIGDMSTNAAFEAFERIIADLKNLYDVEPDRVVCDAHPDYRTTRYAGTLPIARREIQHHHAHIFACMAENELEPPVSGVSWDGTGFGSDGTVWGGEFLQITRGSLQRAGHLRTFRLPGGEQAVHEPRRSAVGLLYEIFSDAVFQMDNVPPILTFSEEDRRILGSMLRKRINSPVTSSAGRLFDVVASLLGLRQRLDYEGQAAMEVEFAAAGADTDESYPFDIANEEGMAVVDWEPMVRAILGEIGESRPVAEISARFHNTLAESIVEMALAMGERRVVLSGGCFQNRYLTERTISRLREAGLTPYWHQRIPPNDGGIALGQIAATMYLDNGGDDK